MTITLHVILTCANIAHCRQWLAELMVKAMPKYRRFKGLRRRSLLAGSVGVLAVTAATAQTSTGLDSKLAACRAITEDAARLRCYEAATSAPPAAPVPPMPVASAGSWRLVRTPNPAGGRDAVSIMQTADVATSDIDLAGLMIRCGEINLETLVVVVTPLPPRAHPKIIVSAAGRSSEFTGTVVPPGAEILLPDEASALLSTTWKAAPELAVRIENESDPVKGVISLTGLGSALQNLRANCTPR